VNTAFAGVTSRTSGTRWWNISRIAGACALAVVIGVFAFLFRFNGLGGSFGGFDNDHFVHLVRSDMLLAGEQPLRDFADAELRGAWPSLGYATTAWAQRLWGRTLLVEAYMTVGGLAIGTLVVFALSLSLSRRWSVGVLAALVVIATAPKLYNYEKVLILAIAALLIRWWILKPSLPRMCGLALWTAAAALFRHDFGVYVAAGCTAALLALGPAPTIVRLRRAAGYVAVTTLLLSPSIAWVQAYQGVLPYVERSLESIRGESGRTSLAWPVLDTRAGVAIPNLIALTYYAFLAIPALAALAMAALAVRGDRLDESTRTTGFALLVLAVAVNAFFLRGNLNARFGDAIAPVAVLAAWIASLSPPVTQIRHAATAALWLAPRGLLAVILACTFVTAEARLELDSGGFSDSWEKVERRYQVVRADLGGLPPTAWHGVATGGTMAAARYLAECTAPEDRILLATYVPEVLVMSRRLFAAGQGTFGLNFYLTDEQQMEAIERLRQQSVPIVLGSYDDFEGEFVHDYRRVYQYVERHYRDAGAILVNGEPRLRVLVEARRPSVSTDAATGLPCFR
jgi:hypothetical protein